MTTKWGSHCRLCGHPSAYHGAGFCQCDAGSTSKARCDCDGYEPSREAELEQDVERLRRELDDAKSEQRAHLDRLVGALEVAREVVR